MRSMKCTPPCWGPPMLMRQRQYIGASANLCRCQRQYLLVSANIGNSMQGAHALDQYHTPQSTMRSLSTAHRTVPKASSVPHIAKYRSSVPHIA